MIHPTAIIEPGAQLGKDVQIGAYSIIRQHVVIGDRTVVGPHVVIEGRTTIGCDNEIFQFASIGAIPQDLKFHGEESTLTIGDRNKIREFTTLHLGTEDGGGKTVVGSDNLFMAYTHVAHDCIVGNHVILANNATLAGHVEVDDYAILGGMSAVHQFTRVGAHVMASGGSMIAQDVPPFVIAQGDRAKTIGLNLIGLKRRGFSSESLSALKKAYRLVFRSGLRQEEALQQIADTVDDCPEVRAFTEFIRTSERGVAR
ncbi:acyl-ACP--UDP-N-acetylglucosamine O-acyltransferase [uncultured Desulfuromonas sp.]|uniref:acyl-ACP--UDP-N-acetylglucosamine O-acyltransferase n=1 Tax=uncultured Desulfuromonas sp. TaxID=181013 RepID=UPI002AAB97D4|nr:acyl-ACP--UDP-N-acetylglucosamine O-acyltransferase [uncultured Desulfuromonas sp.]